MAAGYWGNTIQEFRPGVSFKNYQGTDANTINSRIPIFFSAAHRASWLHDGYTFGSVTVRIRWVDCYASENTAPSVATDPNDSAYNWSFLDSFMAMSNLSLLPGNPIILNFTNSNGAANIPNWFANAGYTRTIFNGSVQAIDYANATGRQAVKDFFTAMAAHLSTSRKFWAFSMSEQLQSSGTTAQLGEAEVLNHIFDAFGGRVSVCVGGNSNIYSTLVNACYPTIGVRFPDPGLFSSSCTPTCSPTSSRGRMQSSFESCPILQSTENNGMNAVSWPNGVSNPFGNNSSTPSHIPTAQEIAWYFSDSGVIPVHVLEWDCTEWSFTDPSLTLATAYTAMDIYMADGNDDLPSLPANYITTPPGSGEPDLPTLDETDSQLASGTSGTGKSVAAPDNLSSGDIILFHFTTAGSLNISGSNVSNVKTNAGSNLSPIISERATDATTRPECAVYYLISDGTETSITFDSLQLWCAGTHRISGAHPTTPIGVTSSNNTGGTSTNTITIPGITTTDDNSIKVDFIALRDGTPTSVTNSGATEKIFEQDPASASRDAAGFYTNEATAGATGDTTITWTNNTRAAAVSIEILGAPTATVDDTAPTLHASSAVTQYAATQTTNDLLWNDATDDTAVIDYILERSLDGSTNWHVIATVTQSAKTASEGGSSYSYRDSGLTADTDYYYRYRARDAVPNISSYSTVSGALSTDTPADTTDPTYAGITGATWDSATGDTTLTHTEATDNVTATNNMKYYVWASTSTIDFDNDDPIFGPVSNPGTGVPSIIIPFGTLTDGTYNFGIRSEDEAGNRDTNTTTVSETIGLILYTITFDKALSTGSAYANQSVEYIWESGAISYGTNQVRDSQSWIMTTTDANGGLSIQVPSNTPGYLNLRTSDGKYWRSIELTPE